MREEHHEQTIAITDLDDHTRDLVREAGQGRLRLVVVDTDGERIAEVRRIEPPDTSDIWANYDPEAARRAWRRGTGVLRGVDVDDLLTEIKAEREQDSSGRPS